MADIQHETRADFYSEYKRDLAQNFSRNVANAAAAPVANALHQAGMERAAGFVRNAANTPEAALLAQIARNTSYLQNRVGGDVFGGFERMQRSHADFSRGVPQMIQDQYSVMQNARASMNRAARIAEEVMKMSSRRMGDTAMPNYKFTHGFNAEQMMDIGLEAARGGAMFPDASPLRGKRIDDPAASPRETAWLISSYAKTVRTMVDFYGSADIDKAIEDFQKITGQSGLASKGDPGHVRRTLERMGSLGVVHGIGRKAGMDAFGLVREFTNQTTAGRYGIDSPLYANMNMFSASNAMVTTEGLRRAREMGVTGEGAKLADVLNEQSAFDNMINMTTGGSATSVLAVLEAKGMLGKKTADEARRSLMAGDMTNFTRLVRDVSSMRFGGDEDYIQDMIRDPNKFAKFMKMEQANMNEDQRKAFGQTFGEWKNTAYNAQQKLLEKEVKAEGRLSRTDHLRSQYGYTEEVDEKDLELGRSLALGEMEDEIKKLRRSDDPNSQRLADDMQASLHRYKLNAKDHGAAQALDMLESTGADSKLFSKLTSWEAFQRGGDLRKAGLDEKGTAYGLGMRVADVDQVAKEVMTKEQRDQLAQIDDPDQRAVFANKVLESHRSKNTGEGAVSRQILDRMGQQRETDSLFQKKEGGWRKARRIKGKAGRKPAGVGEDWTYDADKKEWVEPSEKRRNEKNELIEGDWVMDQTLQEKKDALLEQPGFSHESVMPALSRAMKRDPGLYISQLKADKARADRVSEEVERLKESYMENHAPYQRLKKAADAGSETAQVLLKGVHEKMSKVAERTVDKQIAEEGGPNLDRGVAFPTMKITGKVEVKRNERTGEIISIDFDETEAKQE